MKQLSILALVLAFGARGMLAQQLGTQINLQPGTLPASNITVGGHSSLGVFTFHIVATSAAAARAEVRTC